MTWVDGVILAVIAVSAVLAFFRGLVREVLGVGAWIGAILAALTLRPRVLAVIGDAIQPPWLAEAVAAAGVFLVVLLALKIIIALIARKVEDSILSGTDRALGLVFGLARGAFVVVLAYIIGGLLFPATERWPEAVRNARALPVVADAARRLVTVLPETERPRLVAPPLDSGPTMEDLLRPAPRNRP